MNSIYSHIHVGGTFRVYVAILASEKSQKRSAKWSLQIWNALFPGNFAGTNCKYSKNKHFVGLWCVISNIAGSLKILLKQAVFAA